MNRKNFSWRFSTLAHLGELVQPFVPVWVDECTSCYSNACPSGNSAVYPHNSTHSHSCNIHIDRPDADTLSHSNHNRSYYYICLADNRTLTMWSAIVLTLLSLFRMMHRPMQQLLQTVSSKTCQIESCCCILCCF